MTSSCGGGSALELKVY
ncbi:hypothetical protein CGLO_13210 [Colletotrichum gloeosporioides Cg-14]|uniref:Uncharacterized protein n=1 Tax=Colletotrichum gloeosporioides (strain Cg-14) TaxID=1237896 RepID=T0K472_COLGC|nr:hypothetical protein CGLO_13210 [Colletotrichum gloeosporioides Cg-14]